MPDELAELAWFKRGTATVGDTLRTIGEGLGAAAKAIVVQSRSDVGTLAVKTAEITVEVELTARAEKNGVGIEPGSPVGITGLRFVTDEQSKHMTNRATVKLTVVAVTEPTDAKADAKDSDKDGTGAALRPRPADIDRRADDIRDRADVAIRERPALADRSTQPTQPERPKPRWPWDRWEPKSLHDFLGVVDKVQTSVALEPARDPIDPVPGDRRVLVALASQVANLLTRIRGSTDAEREGNPQAAEIERALANAGEMLVHDSGQDYALRVQILTTTAMIAAYFKGVLSAGSP
ncbi:MAG TPA: hypothetical protein VM261_35840 [Kofleriaceae bacterium]|nr:hypothetical protein [Kofleriaceae bacterium]